MNSRQHAALEAKIQQWMDDNSDLEDWPDVIVGTKTAPAMTLAAKSVFDAIEDAQDHAKREGYWKYV